MRVKSSETIILFAGFYVSVCEEKKSQRTQKRPVDFVERKTKATTLSQASLIQIDDNAFLRV